MNAQIRPLADINQKATAALVREIGIVDTLRFLGQFGVGTGNYTKERRKWLGDLSVEEIASEIRSQKTAS